MIDGVRCRHCGSDDATRIVTRGGQDSVYCDAVGCEGRYSHNAPRAETGREVRSLRTRPDIKPSQRARIIDRDNSTCVFCGARPPDIRLEIEHLISVEMGRSIGLDDIELYDDENLAAMCASCNSGMSVRPVSMRFAANLLRARIQHEKGATA